MIVVSRSGSYHTQVTKSHKSHPFKEILKINTPVTFWYPKQKKDHPTKAEIRPNDKETHPAVETKGFDPPSFSESHPTVRNRPQK